MLEHNICLQDYNTFHLQVNAKNFVRINSLSDIQKLTGSTFWNPEMLCILGGGSNVLFLGDYPGLIIKNEIMGISKVQEDEKHVWLQVGAGENWHGFVLHCVEQGYCGIENLSLIPGTVGAAPIQNIGAYGVELKNVFVELTAIEISTGQPVTFDHAACQFGYRDSVFKREYKNQYIICSVLLKLSKEPRLCLDYGAIEETLAEMKIKKIGIKAVSDAVIHIRKQKLPNPKVIPNAGSFFKNPVISRKQFESLHAQYSTLPHYVLNEREVKVPAAWLIETCGWKGKRIQDAGVHDQQALVLVNHGKAKGLDILALSEKIKEDVASRFEIQLDPEVTCIGPFSEKLGRFAT